jgi:hypothetical protein
MSDLRPIIDACTPRPEILEGGLADNHFAAQLDQVVRNPKAYPIYGDAEQFFEITHPTRGLRDLLARTFGRLSGSAVPGAEHGVVRSETSFGGGKTHGLMAVYHVAKGARPRRLAEFIDPGLLPRSCQIAAVVGDTLDPTNGLMTNGHRTFTLWGEIGAQLGDRAFQQMRSSDGSRTAPGKETLAEMVGDEPTIIIIDELAQHLRQLTSAGDPDVRRQAEALPAFLKALFELAAGNPRVVVILTLATRTDAFGKESDELSEMLQAADAAFRRTLSDTQSIVARSTSGSSIVKPAEDAEIAEILKRRLFTAIDRQAAAEAAHAYQELYEELARRGERLAGGAEAPATYAKLIEASYPFHPELIRVLDKRIGTIPNFQRARGALKLLAEVIAGLWASRSDAEIVNVADIDYDREAVLAHLTVGIGRPDFEGVAKADFAGDTAHAATVDAGRFAGRRPYATRACRTVFTHSLEMVSTAGAGRTDYLLGTLRVADDPEVIGEALAAVEKLAWHLDYDGTRWRFSTEPQPNKIIDEEAVNVPNSMVGAEVEERVHAAFPKDGLVEVVHAPSGPASVKDAPALRLVVMHHDDVNVHATGVLPPPPKLVQILDRQGVSEGIRTYRNALAFLVADADAIEYLKEKVRRDVAAHRIVNDKARMAVFASEVQQKLRRIADTTGLEARVALLRCYRHLYFPTADKANSYLRHEELPPKSTGDVVPAQTKVIVESLKEFGKVRTQAMSTDYLHQKAWPKQATEISTAEVEAAFWKDHGAQLLLDSTILQTTIREGARNGDWVYYVAEEHRAYTTKDPAPPVRFAPDCFLYTPERAKELGLVGRPLRWDDAAAVLASQPVITGPALRAALETAIGKEPTKTEVLEVLARAAEGGENARAVVVAGLVEPGVKALSPFEIKKLSLDVLTILMPAEGDKKSIVRPSSRKAKAPVEASGPAGVAFQALIDRASDTPDVTGFTMISVAVTMSPAEGIKPISLLGKAIGMLPKFEIDSAADIELDFQGLTPGVEVKLSGTGKDYQRVEAALMAFAKAASGSAGSLRLDIRFAKPAPPNGDEVKTLRKVMTDLQPGELRLKGVLA